MRYLLLLFLFLQISSGEAHSVDYLFVLYDAGETHALAPVIQRLHQEGCHYEVLVMGTARREVQGLGLAQVIDLNSDLGVDSYVDNIHWQRQQTLSQEDLDRLQELEPATVITGVASTVQWQVADYFGRRGAPIIAFYDNLYFPLDKHPYQQVVAPFQEVADLFLVPANHIAPSLAGNVVVVGQPTLAVWKEKVDAVDKDAVRRTLGVEKGRRIITYCGGYGGTYPEAFELFAQSLASLPGDYQVIVQLHPKVDGLFEKGVLNHLGLKEVLCNKDTVSTIEAVAIADVVVCHQSTVAIQALFAGKKVIHVDVPESTFTTFAIESGLTPLVTSAPALAEQLHQRSPYVADDLYDRAGIPPNAVDNIIREIERHRSERRRLWSAGSQFRVREEYCRSPVNRARAHVH